MDFGYSPEQNQLRKTIRDFAEVEIRPHVMEWDESQEFPVDVFRALGNLGVLGAVFPESLGGSDTATSIIRSWWKRSRAWIRRSP